MPQADAAIARARRTPVNVWFLLMAGSVCRRPGRTHRPARGISFPRAREGSASCANYDRPRAMTPFRRWLPRGFGLRARMTASYVLVTFAAVIVVEVLAGILVLPNVNEQADLASRVVNTANDYAKQYEPALTKAARAYGTPDVALGKGGTPDVALGKGGSSTAAASSRSVQEAVIIRMLAQQPLGHPGAHLG